MREGQKSPTCDSCLGDDAKDLFLHLGVVAEFLPGALHLHLLRQGHQLLLVGHHEADHVRLVAVRHAVPMVTDITAQNEFKCSHFCRGLPVCIGTDVVNEGAVLQDGLHLPQRHVLAGLQLHQVLFAVFITERVLTSKQEPKAAALLRPPPTLPMILRQPSE